MKYQGIIFDLDGVLCHTDLYHYQAWKQLADRLGIPFDEQVNDRLRGVSRAESLEIILELSPVSYTAEDKLSFMAEKNDRYRALLMQMTPADVSDDVRMTLDTLKKRGLRLAIGSSSKNTGLILERLGLDGYFDAVADGTQITHSKPDPEVFLLAARLLRLVPANALVIEDAAAGIAAAAAGDFDSAGIGPAALCPDAAYPLEKLSDLLTIL